MVILGAKGHAKEVIDVFEKNNFENEIFLFDNISKELSSKLFNKYTIINSISDLKRHFRIDPSFVLGTGGVETRKKLHQIARDLNGELKSIISKYAILGNYEVNIEEGVNIMHNVFISNSVGIGKGTLINTGSYIHHDVEVGEFCEVCPNTKITGNVKIGNSCFIGTGTIIAPNVNIGNDVVIGAGSVILKDIPSLKKVYGVYNG